MLSRRSFIGPVILLLLVAVVYPAYWFFAADRVEKQFGLWVAALKADGYTVAHGEAAVSGFPGIITLSVAKPDLAAPAGAWRWQGGAVALKMQPWNWWRYRVEFPGRHTLHYADPETLLPMQAVPENAAMVVRITGKGRFAEGELAVQSLRALNAAGGAVMTLGTVWGQLAQPGTAEEDGAAAPTATLSVTIDDMKLPAAAKGPLGGDVKRLQLAADWQGPLPRDWTREGLDEWRRASGTVEARWLNIHWGPLDLRARGTMALDQELRPLGALTADIRGFSETLDALERARMLKTVAAAAARIAFNVMAKPAPKSGEKVLTVPVSAQDGFLQVGPLQLLRLKPLSLPSR
jgi:hypothetical protein